MDSPTDEASFQVEIPVERKPRRSSIFKPSLAEPSLPLNEDNFPPNYRTELLQENLKWKEACADAKAEYLALKNVADHANKSDFETNFKYYEMYLEKAEAFCCQVNNLNELHKNAIDYLNIRKQELERQVQATSQIIREKLNM